MTFAAAFPRSAGLEPDALFWEAPFDWMNPDVDLLEALWTLQVAKLEDLAGFWSWTEAIVADFADARGAAGGAAAVDAIDCARFITCIPALHATRVSGQLGACYDWVWTAIAPTHVRGQRLNENVFSFLIFPHAPDALLQLYVGYVPNFAAAAFYLAFKFGGLDQLTAAIARGSWECSKRAYAQEPRDGAAIEAIIQMVTWAAHQDWPDGQVWAEHLLGLLETTPVLEHRKDIAIAFITPAFRYTNVSVRDRTNWILENFNSVLGEHERLQVLAAGMEGPEDWAARRAAILDEIGRVRALHLASVRPGQSNLEALEQRVSILWPIAYSLGLWGEVGDLVEVLGAWYRAAGQDPADADLLTIIPTHGGGAAYLWPGGRWLTGDGTYTTHNAMQRASSEALGSYYRGADGDHDSSVYQDFRFDIVDAKAGYTLEAAMRDHYQFAELRARLPEGWSPRALMVFPSGPEPIQGMLMKDAGIAAPLEISFECPLELRPIRKISVWAGGPWHEAFELEAIQHVAQRAGWSVGVTAPQTPTADDLRRFYEDPDADVCWVISHGAHDPFAIGGTGLHLPDETLVSLEELQRWTTPEAGRRLLVLNSCSGATAQGRGGLARIGLAQSLVGQSQGVVGHLWPVHWTAGLAFGAALVACLEDDPSASAVLRAAALLRQPDDLMRLLETRFADCPGLLERLQRSGEDLESLINWGCPVLLT
ncbi:hypothetical protein DA69_01405 [Brevundimonas naejangsanensis]|uniref:CHAT domain-containing protein n=1 Tax=Brevundimonas naejangsanensis TaxID=588932 RepID=A0A172Y2W3_9CAUL|nr:CHAT domain-containing protein [Brevundimonas naejangsanensis]ANF53540.1 hypothetical protein DA69_01405 [Brevundimonas naejangsanensis]